MTPDGELLRRFVNARSEEAFAELVRRHLDLVFSSALRQLNGDVHFARDVAQSVFADLARKAPDLVNRPVLTGWLYTSVHFAAANAVRTEQRRRAREQEASAMNELLNHSASEVDWQKLRPAIDEVMHKLSASERDVLLMRFFENRPLADIGARLGLSEDAARKRIERALEKLRGFLAKRGFTTAGSLAAVLSAHAVETAPVGLAASLTGASLAAASSASSGGAPALMKILAMTKLQTASLGALLLASVVTSVVIVQSAHAKISRLDLALQQQADQLPQLQADKDKLSFALNWAASHDQVAELASAREKIETLRAKTNDLQSLRAQHDHLVAELKKAREQLSEFADSQATTNSPELHSKIRYVMSLAMSMWDYADSHHDRFPTNLNDVVGHLNSDQVGATNLSLDMFEIDYQGTRESESSFAHQGEVVLVSEKQPWQNSDGKWVKAWAALNAIGRPSCPIDGDFDAWAARHTASAPASTDSDQ